MTRRRGRFYGELIEEVRPFEGARELIASCAPAACAACSPAPPRRGGRPLRRAARRRRAVHGLDDLGRRRGTKPEPDLVAAAMRKAGALTAVMVGDTAWDVEAARARGRQEHRDAHRRVR